MELIFDSIEERDKFFDRYCPSVHFGQDCENCGEFPVSDGRCRKCWEQSGVKYRVKTTYNDTDIPQRIKRIKELYDTAVHNDPGFRPDDYDWIVGEAIIDHIADNGLEYRSVGQKYKSLMGICVTVDYDYPLRVSLCKKTRKEPKFVVMPRHQGRTAAKHMLDELERTGYIDTDKASTFSVLSKLDHQFYHNKNWKEALEVFMDKHDRIKKPQIEKVIFNDPATIVFWKDGTKTVVKVRKGDRFDPEKGLAMAICKKVLGNADGEYWTENFKKWLPKEKTLAEIFQELSDKLQAAFKVPTFVMHTDNAPPLVVGKITIEEGAKTKEEPVRLKDCADCKHEKTYMFDEPCNSCMAHDKFEEKKETIIYRDHVAYCPKCNGRLPDFVYRGRREGYCVHCGTKLVR